MFADWDILRQAMVKHRWDGVQDQAYRSMAGQGNNGTYHHFQYKHYQLSQLSKHSRDGFAILYVYVSYDAL